MNNIIKSVVREYHFTPETIDDLFMDDVDYHGLLFWYDDTLQIQKELKTPKKTIK